MGSAAAVNKRILCRYINNEVIPKNMTRQDIKHLIRSYNTGTENVVYICMSELFIELCDVRDGRSLCCLDSQSHYVYD